MRIGFIGLGNVGGKLAGSLLRNGADLRVHDLDAALVAAFGGTGHGPWRGCGGLPCAGRLPPGGHRKYRNLGGVRAGHV